MILSVRTTGFVLIAVKTENLNTHGFRHGIVVEPVSRDCIKLQELEADYKCKFVE
jgi:hypothetical protein